MADKGLRTGSRIVGILGIFLSLFGLMYLAYRGVNVVILAPLMAMLAVLFEPSAPLMASYTQVFMPALGGYLLKFFPLFLLGAVFGKLMGDSGAAATIGRVISRQIGVERAVIAVTTSCAVLTYGGVSLFVVAFCMYPIAAQLFREGDIPKRLIPGAIALGSFTFTMTALPGTPAIQNAIPMPYFGTTLYAAPGLGFIAACIMAGAGVVWLQRRAAKAKAKGEGFGEEASLTSEDAPDSGSREGPGFLLSMLPLALVLVLNLVFTKLVIPTWDTGYLSESKYGGKTLDDVLGIWAVLMAIAIAVVVLIFSQRKFLNNPLKSVNDGTMGSLLPIFNTASEVGYGATVASLGSFATIKSGILGIFPQYPLVSEAVAINVLAGITGSASGGLSIALKALAEHYVQVAQAADISLELLHRVATLSCGGFDALPHNGAVITLLAICGLTHKQSYLDVFMVSVLFPVASTVTVVLLGSLFGSF